MRKEWENYYEVIDEVTSDSDVQKLPQIIKHCVLLHKINKNVQNSE